jgi:hypothetical protein
MNRSLYLRLSLCGRAETTIAVRGRKRDGMTDGRTDTHARTHAHTQFLVSECDGCFIKHDVRQCVPHKSSQLNLATNISWTHSWSRTCQPFVPPEGSLHLSQNPNISHQHQLVQPNQPLRTSFLYDKF